MKNLIDIVAVELKSWPRMAEGGTYLCQDSDNGLIEDTGTVNIMMLSERARDADTARIFKADWQAAVEALKAEQAAELKWPDGAEFVGTTTGETNKYKDQRCFYRHVNQNWSYEYMYESDDSWRLATGAPVHTPLIPRPAERAVEWDGVGLPPVGTVCEAETSRGWSIGTVIAHGLPPKENLAVWQEDGDLIFWGEMSYFRPARTQEQIAADVRMAGLNEMIGHIKDHPMGTHGVKHIQELRIHEDAVRDLWEAGYRKQVAE